MRKKCLRCKETKSAEDYHKDKTTADGYKIYCKLCIREYNKTIPTLLTRERTLKSRYGLSFSDYERMLENQSGACAICENTVNGKYSMSVDHCHASGKVRKLLCNRCNSILGYSQDNPDLLRKAAYYLDEFKIKASPKQS